MGLGDFHSNRRLVSLFALAGAVLYTALIPGHVVSQATARAVAHGAPGSVEAALQTICHGGVPGTYDPAAPSGPPAPHKKCPFCTGYAAFVTALAGDCDAGVLDAERAPASFAAFDDGFVESAARHPHNRGPPLEL